MDAWQVEPLKIYANRIRTRIRPPAADDTSGEGLASYQADVDGFDTSP